MRRAFGTWACFADAAGVTKKTLEEAAGRKGQGTAILAYRAAQAAGTTLEAVLTGAVNAAGRCSACGSRIGGSREVRHDEARYASRASPAGRLVRP